MLHLFRPRGELQALKQLTASLPISAQGTANWAEVQREWTSREQKAVRDDARIAELERELEAARLMLAEADASARASETRFDLVNRASSEGLWDMEVIAGDPVNPRNRFWWSQQFRGTFPTCWPAGPTACTPKTRPLPWMPLPAT